jgi:prevent-host-death family protein
MLNDRDVPASEVRQHFAEHLDRVRAGESFTITRNGRITARLTPAPEETTDDD